MPGSRNDGRSTFASTSGLHTACVVRGLRRSFSPIPCSGPQRGVRPSRPRALYGSVERVYSVTLEPERQSTCPAMRSSQFLRNRFSEKETISCTPGLRSLALECPSSPSARVLLPRLLLCFACITSTCSTPAVPFSFSFARSTSADRSAAPVGTPCRAMMCSLAIRPSPTGPM